MKLRKIAIKYGSPFLLAGSVPSAYAFDTAAVETAINTAGTNAGTIAGLVLVAVAAIAGVGVIMSLIKRV